MPPRTKPKERALAGPGRSGEPGWHLALPSQILPVPSAPGRSAVQKSQSVPVTKLPPPPFSPSRFPLHIVLSLAPRLTTDDQKFPGVDDDGKRTYPNHHNNLLFFFSHLHAAPYINTKPASISLPLHASSRLHFNTYPYRLSCISSPPTLQHHLSRLLRHARPSRLYIAILVPTTLEHSIRSATTVYKRRTHPAEE
ncbi:hypothetical protein QR685DRAFT_38939 [Neurospora intermedia]|uniref:Uncharacterized protein n=1 Tax=Neurospora intermedia TaxID=5142 RepID=A0ABR3DRB1_NEUIN